MNWDDFKSNVIKWAAERGILENSTPFGQLSKTASEFGELYEAIVKGDKEGIKDGVGDTAVTLVIVAHMWGVYPKEPTPGVVKTDICLSRAHHALADMIEDRLRGNRPIRIAVMLANIATIASRHGFNFMDCCAYAWDQIKDRKGYLSPGGVFIKEDPAVSQGG